MHSLAVRESLMEGNNGSYAKIDGFKSTKGKKVMHFSVPKKTLAKELIKMADQNPHNDTLISS